MCSSELNLGVSGRKKLRGLVIGEYEAAFCLD